MLAVLVLEKLEFLLEFGELRRIGYVMTALSGARRYSRRCRAARSNPWCGIGSNLWSWQRAQVTVRPRKPLVTTSMRSLMMSFMVLKALADGEKAQGGELASSCCDSGSWSAAICSMMNWL